MIQETDEALVERARGADRQALEALLMRHQAQIYRFSMKMCRNPQDAQDVLQDTLLALARGVREFRGASSISTWLYRVARNFCIKKRRKEKDTTRVDQDMPIGTVQSVGVAPSPDDALAGAQVQHALEQAIASLQPGYREVLILRDVEGLPAAEVAEIVGLRVQAVKSRLHRARRLVRQQLAPILTPPDHPIARVAAADVPRNDSCPDVLTLYSRYLENEISAEVCAEMERHLQSCPRCRATCDSLKQTLALCRTASPAAEVPEKVQSAVKIALKNFLVQKV